MAVHFLKGNIFESQAQWLINPVNCKGVMGAGLAKEFKKRFGVNYEAYFNYCKYGNLKPGDLYITHSDCGTTIVNFPTKDDWRDAVFLLIFLQARRLHPRQSQRLTSLLNG